MEKLEEELKYRLPAKEDIELVAETLGDPEKIENQHNYYFDTPGLFLHSQGILLRIRICNDGMRFIFTVKIAQTIKKGFISSREEEFDLDPGSVAKIINKPAEYLCKYEFPLLKKALERIKQPEHLRLIAELFTHRRIYNIPEGELALDILKIREEEEYEIELETKKAAAGKVFLENLFDKLNLKAWKESSPKTGRLFQKLGLVK